MYITYTGEGSTLTDENNKPSVYVRVPAQVHVRYSFTYTYTIKS